MANSYFSDQTFKSAKSIEKGEYEVCRFENCILPNSDFSGITFIECEFINCDFSSSKLYDASFNDVIFKDSKLLGLRFEDCNEFLFSIEFQSCNLNLTSFYQMNPKSIVFRDCNLKEVDFTEADLAETLFDKCDLDAAIFKNTNLKKADFSSSYNFSIDPQINNIQQAKFSLQGLPGLLEKFNLNIE
ncbi:MAG: pentapeptide repeat-containing protein [Balneolaceae bacterium]|nr:pentapeptide repeat-containing protein [Balneolaceae bacterium]